MQPITARQHRSTPIANVGLDLLHSSAGGALVIEVEPPPGVNCTHHDSVLQLVSRDVYGSDAD